MQNNLAYRDKNIWVFTKQRDLPKCNFSEGKLHSLCQQLYSAKITFKCIIFTY